MRIHAFLAALAAFSLVGPSALAQTYRTTWTTSADFEVGAPVFANVNVTDVPDQLQLNLSGIETPYLWISNTGGDSDSSTGRHTIAQMSSEDGRVIRAVQLYNGQIGHQPSRTAVDVNFNCWVAYRGYWSAQGGDWGINAVARLGAEDPDLDFLFTNQHYRDPGELDLDFDVWDRPRAVAINVDGNVWVGNWDDTNMVLLDPATGRPINTFEPDLPLWDPDTHGATEYQRPHIGGGNSYGMAVDARGNLWVAQRGSRVGQYDARTGEHIMTYSFSFGTSFYGIAVDLDGNVWLGNWTADGLVYLPRQAVVPGQLGIEECLEAGGASCAATAARRIQPSNPTIVAQRQAYAAGGDHGAGTCDRSRGVAVDQAGTVWVNCFNDDDVLQATIGADGEPFIFGAYRVGDGPLGITATADGHIWTVNQNGGGPNRLGSANGYTCPNGFNPDSGGTATRMRGSNGTVINSYPTCGVQPYTYSDLAGYTLRSVTLRSGFWRQEHDAGDTRTGLEWGRLDWTLVNPGSTEIELSVGASDVLADLSGALPYTYIVPPGDEAGIDFDALGFDLQGRYFAVEARLFTRNDFLGPIIEDLTLSSVCIETGETCNGFDDDCDGFFDEGPDNEPLLGAACLTGLPGICNNGQQQCQGGEFVCIQTVDPQTEVCDGITDEDCDGEVDEGVTNACGFCGDTPEEVCNLVDDDCDDFVDEGVRATCLDYSEGPNRCSTFINPTCGPCAPAPPELCGDGIDNNCNGLEDEGVARACTDYRAMVGGQPNDNLCGVVQVCGDCPGPPAETCDGVDNNCNGAIDEGAENRCTYDPDIEGCTEFFQCEPCPAGPPEICNGRDDNCNEAIDEGVTNDCGTCGPPPVEVCDGIDNDCDGETDEGLTNACGFCGDLPREICDGIDNDCDGGVDEGVGNACGTCGPAPLELCNGLDDNCDGEVDEGVKNRCGGCGLVPPEVCDDIDNDCDGDTDEDTEDECERELLGSVCAFGECALPCAAGECPVVGQICRENFCVTNPCAGVTCDTGFRCVAGECTSLCELLDITCEGDLVCVAGSCVEDVCSNTGCDPGFACVDNECVRDRCFEVDCGVGFVCDDGMCIDDPCLEIECGDDLVCAAGNCVDPCEDVECGRAELCDGGFCVPDACFDVNCGEGSQCVDGNCVFDACVGVVCDLGQVCLAGECVVTRAGGACGDGLSRCGEGLVCWRDDENNPSRGTCRDINDPELIELGFDPENPNGSGGSPQQPVPEGCGCAAASGGVGGLAAPWLVLLVGVLAGRIRRWWSAR